MRRLSSRQNRLPNSELSVHGVAEDEEEGEAVVVAVVAVALTAAPATEMTRELVASPAPAVKADHGIPISLCVCRLSRHCG